MYTAIQTAGEKCAGPSCSIVENTSQAIPTKVTFPLSGSEFARLNHYLISKNLELEIRNKISCKLRVSRDSITIYPDHS